MGKADGAGTRSPRVVWSGELSLPNRRQYRAIVAPYEIREGEWGRFVAIEVRQVDALGNEAWFPAMPSAEREVLSAAVLALSAGV